MSAIHWFEILVEDFERAKSFYETVMNLKVFVNDQRESMGSMLGVFPRENGVGGCLVNNQQFGYTPSADGTVVDLKVTGDLNNVQGRIANAGGEVLLRKTTLEENAGGGLVSWVRDSEGNKVGFDSEE